MSIVSTLSLIVSTSYPSTYVISKIKGSTEGSLFLQKEGPIDAPKKVSEVKKDPYTLPAS